MIAAFIQARLGSTRLPGKVLKKIGEKPQLLHLLDRISGTKKLDRVIVLTSDLQVDDELAFFCAGRGVQCFRGSEQDVLDRFYRCAQELKMSKNDVIVRITADCPLHHREVVDFAVREFQEKGYDYFSNSFAPDYEDGCDTEVFTFAALEASWERADLLSQREHVTPYIKDSGFFSCGYKKFNAEYKFKLSVDTPDDLSAVAEIFRYFAPRTDFSINEVVSLLQARPEIARINASSVINAGYAKSIENDKRIKK
ncbi:MAG: glycosyltransferase family protein [Bacteroidota bacterium]